MRILTRLAIGLVAMALTTSLARAIHPITYYYYLTEQEITRHGELIWFWTPDTAFGPYHSNDYIGLRYSPTFFDSVWTSRDVFRYYMPGNITFRCEPVFNAPPINLPRSFPNIRDFARFQYQDQDGRLLTTIRFRGADGIFVYQKPLGSDIEDSLIAEIPTANNQAICVEGKLELEGIVSGRVTVYATEDIGLLDDLRYYGSNDHDGSFDQDTTTSMLAVISEKNILIRNTLRNGKDNGSNVARNDWNRHSIVLNGSYIALHSTFEIDQQNDDWNFYQGPNPDERGWIYLTGGMTMERKGYFHRSNHMGTGYGQKLRYDKRLKEQYPVGLAPEDLPDDFGYLGRKVYGSGSHTIRNIYVNTIIAEPGADLRLYGSRAIAVLDTLILQGTDEHPVFIRASSQGAIHAEECSYVLIEHAIFEKDVTLHLEGCNPVIKNSIFNNTPSLSGSVTIDSCRFKSPLEHQWTGDFRVSRSTFLDQGIVFSGGQANLELDHVTIAGGNGIGLELVGGANATVANSIVSHFRRGIRSDNRSSMSIRYCTVAGNAVENFIGCQPGEGTITLDPDYYDLRNGDLRLTEDSPCIDAGDPNSPRDPDGTRADIGAFYFDHELAVGEGDFTLCSQGGNTRRGVLSATPNPFNSTTVIRFQSIQSVVNLSIYDLAGRTVAEIASPAVFARNEETKQSQGGLAKTSSVTWDASAFPAGIYIVRYANGREVQTMKLLKVN